MRIPCCKFSMVQEIGIVLFRLPIRWPIVEHLRLAHEYVQVQVLPGRRTVVRVSIVGL
jgi:hypothetical protein